MTWSTVGTVHQSARDFVPTWLYPVVDAVDGLDAHRITTFLPAADSPGRHSAVLMLFGPDQDLLLIERAHDSSQHSGQPAFPGGAVDPTDTGVVDTALREAREETGLDPSGVMAFGQLPDLWIPVSNYVVTPVLGFWATPSEIAPGDPREVASVHQIPIEEFVDPRNRVKVALSSGYVGNGFKVANLLVWGFTGGLISSMLDLTGWARPWDQTRVVPISPSVNPRVE